MMKTTCQICAREIKSKTGCIAHHGYKRPGNGWQTASCYGALYSPYEISCNALPGAIQRVTDFIKSVSENLDQFLSSPPAIIKRMDRYGLTRPPQEFKKPDTFNSGERPCSYNFNQQYELEFFSRVREMESSIKSAKRDLVFMEDRLAKWKPERLI